MPKVFVVQNQQRWDDEAQMLVPKYPTISKAEEYGEIEFLLSPSAAPFTPEPIIRELADKLSRYTEHDYLLLIGNPVLIGWACALAADYADGRLQVLQWGSGRYIPVRADLDVSFRAR